MRWDGDGDDGADGGDDVDDDPDDAGMMVMTMAVIPPFGRENSPADFSQPEPFFSIWFPPRGGGGKIPLRCPRRF